MRKAVLAALVAVVVPLTAAPSQAIATRPGPAIATRLNLSHLDWLRRPITLVDGQKLTTWQIYATAVRKGDRKGPFRFVGDEDEGVGCIDDVARAALVYLEDFEQTRSAKSLATARDALTFVHALATPDGTYYNFVLANGEINRDGPTSQKGLNWWTARALWASAAGARVFKRSDPAFARLLKQDTDRTVATLIRDQARNYGQFRAWGPLRIPRWFVGDAADVTSVVVLALGDLYGAHPTPEVRNLLARYAEAIASYSAGDAGRYPYFAHMPSGAVTNWHAYGAHMLQALALSGRLLADPALIAAAVREADHFTTHLLISGGPIWGFTPAPREFPQIAYNVSTQTQGLLELYRSTRRPRYGQMAGLMASWLLGNNLFRQPMYDPASGRVWDGIDAKGVSFDSGAESTIEGILTLQALARYPQFGSFVHARELSRVGPVMIEAEAGVASALTNRHEGTEFSGDVSVRLLPGATLSLPAPQASGEYLLGPIAMRRLFIPGEAASLRVDSEQLSQAYSLIYPQPEAPWPTLEAGFLTKPYRLLTGQPISVAYLRDAEEPLDLDGLVAQPAVEYRVFDSGPTRIALVKNMVSERRVARLPGVPVPVVLEPYQSRLLSFSRVKKPL